MKKKIIIVSIIMLLMFIIGLGLIFSASSIWNDGEMRSAIIIRNGGVMDTHHLNSIIESKIFSLQIGGLVISLIGGFGLLGIGYILLKENNNTN